MKSIAFASILSLAAVFTVAAEEPACSVGYVHCSRSEGCCPVAVSASLRIPPDPVPIPPQDPKFGAFVLNGIADDQTPYRLDWKGDGSFELWYEYSDRTEHISAPAL